MQGTERPHVRYVQPKVRQFHDCLPTIGDNVSDKRIALLLRIRNQRYKQRDAAHECCVDVRSAFAVTRCRWTDPSVHLQHVRLTSCSATLRLKAPAAGAEKPGKVKSETCKAFWGREPQQQGSVKQLFG